MINLLADYLLPDGRNGYTEIQISDTDDTAVALNAAPSHLEDQGKTVLLLTRVHGDFTLKQLRAIHLKGLTPGLVYEAYLYDLYDIL